MQTVSQVRDVPCQVRDAAHSASSRPCYRPEKEAHTAFEYVKWPPPTSGPANVQCHAMTTFHAYAHAPGKSTKWKANSKQQSLHRHSYPPQVQATAPAPQVFFNAYAAASFSDPRVGAMVTGPPPPPPHCDPYYYTLTQHQAFFPAGYHQQHANPQPSGGTPFTNGYRPQGMHTTPTRPYVTIAQFNYQPIGYQGTLPTYATPPRDRRSDTSSYYHYSSDLDRAQGRLEGAFDTRCYPRTPYQPLEDVPRRLDDKSDSSGSFEFTIQPEQIVNSLCDDQEMEGCPATPGADNPCAPTPWTEQDVMNPLRIEDDDLTKFIVEGCVKAEGIAMRNQHRPCFKNIKHLCNRTRTDILKPRTTVANIHSQGIPWATKDFIFAFVRLVNCWYILKGYLDDHDGSLGKIEATLSTDFKDCYQRWQTTNREMVKHLIEVFVNLDNGVTIQNAEIFSSFNSTKEDVKTNPTASYLDRCRDLLQKTETKSQKEDPKPDSVPEEESGQTEEVVNIPGILRIKEVFPECEDLRNKIYMKPGSYRVPQKKTPTSPDRGIDADAENSPPTVEDNQETTIHRGEDLLESILPTGDLWRTALETIGPFMKNVLRNSDSFFTVDSKDVDDVAAAKSGDTQDWVNGQDFQGVLQESEEEVGTNTSGHYHQDQDKDEICRSGRTFSELDDDRSERGEDGGARVCLWAGGRDKLTPLIVGKFENIINALWHLQFAKYITFEVNAEKVPDYTKYMPRPVFLYNIMNNLKQNKYEHANQVVHDLRSIVWNSETYIENHPDCCFEKCLSVFAEELECQLSKHFSFMDFSADTCAQPVLPTYEYFGELSATFGPDNDNIVD